MPVLPAVRRLVARRPWIQWVAITAIGVAVAASVADALAAVDAERTAWGTSVTVWVAAADTSIGEPIEAEAVEVPEAVRPPGAIELDEVAGSLARQEIGRGEMIVALDLWAPDDELALAPPGWLVAPVEESPPSGAGFGDRVQVASDGFVVAADAVVVGFVDGVTLVAVPADLAPLLPMASTTSSVTLLRAP